MLQQPLSIQLAFTTALANRGLFTYGTWEHVREELPFYKGFSSFLSLSLSSTLDPIQFILIPVLAYYLKPIKDGYPNLVILTLINDWFTKLIIEQLSIRLEERAINP